MEGKIKSLLIAGFYPLLYFTCQVSVQMIIIKGKYGGGINLVQKVNEQMYMMILYSASLCFLKIGRAHV